MYIDDTQFESAIQNDVIIDFYAEWCGPCKLVSDVLGQTQVKTKVVKMDVDKNGYTPMALGIRSIPTLVFFKNGNEVHRHTGVIRKDEFESLVKKIY